MGKGGSSTVLSLPEAKQQSKQWVEAGGSAPKEAKLIVSPGMTGVFWDPQHQVGQTEKRPPGDHKFGLMALAIHLKFCKVRRVEVLPGFVFSLVVRVKVCEIAESVGISEEKVRNILH
ncbi:hypothetical protein LAZ67_5002052 [Cordylochernes scorpioides]|uniref:Uncharacterized protein n=1 Tax=Cordylochernes scorpioides TaxID=51811 RepID=A0ABY6KHW2_9ARAC|nr:hypothetical protein LAZ67_5002052 [Cordylochernes scorpioides]